MNEHKLIYQFIKPKGSYPYELFNIAVYIAYIYIWKSQIIQNY